jgi:hypothetical protein
MMSSGVLCCMAVTVMMETLCAFETSVLKRATCCNIPEDGIFKNMIFHYQNAGQNWNMKIANRSFDNMSQLKYFGMTLTIKI